MIYITGDCHCDFFRLTFLHSSLDTIMIIGKYWINIFFCMSKLFVFCDVKFLLLKILSYL